MERTQRVNLRDATLQFDGSNDVSTVRPQRSLSSGRPLHEATVLSLGSRSPFRDVTECKKVISVSLGTYTKEEEREKRKNRGWKTKGKERGKRRRTDKERKGKSEGKRKEDGCLTRGLREGNRCH